MNTYMLIYKHHDSDSIITAWIKAHNIGLAVDGRINRHVSGKYYTLIEVKLDE